MLRLYTKCKYIASFRTISPEMDPLRLGFGWTIEDLDNTDALPDENTMRLVNSRMNVKFVSNYRTQIRRKPFASGSKPYANGFRLRGPGS